MKLTLKYSNQTLLPIQVTAQHLSPSYESVQPADLTAALFSDCFHRLRIRYPFQRHLRLRYPAGQVSTNRHNRINQTDDKMHDSDNAQHSTYQQTHLGVSSSMAAVISSLLPPHARCHQNHCVVSIKYIHITLHNTRNSKSQRGELDLNQQLPDRWSGEMQHISPPSTRDTKNKQHADARMRASTAKHTLAKNTQPSQTSYSCKR